MASIYKNEDGYWCIDYRVEGRRTRKSLKTRDKRLAEQKLAETRVRLERRALGFNEDITIEEFEKIYFEHSRATKSFRTYKMELRLWDDFKKNAGV